MEPSVAVVIPAYNAAHLLPRVLDAVTEAAKERARILVVDPGSTDGTHRVAEDRGIEVIRLPERAGPAHARNVGVDAVSEEVVLFIDSDCVPKADVIARVQAAFSSRPELVSLTGSYCDDPPEPGFFSQYMNLRHHSTHQRAKTEGAGFWAGCGAVRRRAFLDVGGFDAEQFPMPMIEDIELGMRLRTLGPTALDPALQVTHLKQWTLRSVVMTDIKQRALPWSRLIVRAGELPNDLNLHWSQRVAAALAPFVLLSLLLMPVAVIAEGLDGLLWTLLLPALSLALHFGLVRDFARARGLGFALAAWLFHQVHLIYSAATLAYVTLEHRLAGKKPSDVSPT